MKKLILIYILFLFSSSSLSAEKFNMLDLKFLWIEGSRNLIAVFNKSPYGIKKEHLVFKDNEGIIVDIKSINKRGDKLEITLENELDLKKNYYLERGESRVYGYYTLDFLNKNFSARNTELGVKETFYKTEFSLWSPHATEVSLLVFSPRTKKEIFSKKMTRSKSGIYKTEVLNSEFKTHLKHYMYKVTAFGKTTIGLDPYAKSMSSFNPHDGQKARGVILDLRPRMNYSPIKNQANELDFIAMEAHIRDFSHHNEFLRGTYKGFENSLSHFSDLGVTHLQLLPLQNFHTVNESDRSFQGSRISKDRINYNWGYDPQNYFTPEGWYSLNSFDPMSRINELKNLTSKIHQKKMGVILDVVYNHVFDEDIFESVSPGTYLRRKENGDISYHSGAGASLESRNQMVRKLMIDSLKHFKDYYHIDGFRFDLMGFHDKETMIEIRKALGSDTILYGEAWEFSDLPKHQATTKSSMPSLAKLSAFNDTSRDSYTGFMANKGFVQGNSYELPKVRASIIAGLSDFPSYNGDISQDRYHRFAKRPSEALNFLSIHDGFTLWDKINLSMKASKEERERRVKQALAMLFTSQGKLILHGGASIARSKPLFKNDPESNRAHTSKDVNPENGISYFHENTYKSPDSTNYINWKRANEFRSLNAYTKGLIALRRAVPSLRFNKANSIKNGLKFISKSKESYSEPYKEKSEISKNNHYAGYKSFNDPRLTDLTIEFINIPSSARNLSFFLAGEVHKNDLDKNPKNNKFEVHFYSKGNGKITLSKNDLNDLDLEAWSDPDSLQFKLIKVPGKWESIPESYSNMGNNSIHPSKILKGNRVVIDLSVVNHRAGQNFHSKNNYIAYSLDNTLENKTFRSVKKLDVSKLLIIHNNGNKDLVINHEEIKDPSKWNIYIDADHAGTAPIKNSSVIIQTGQVIVKRNSTTLIAK